VIRTYINNIQKGIPKLGLKKMLVMLIVCVSIGGTVFAAEVSRGMGFQGNLFTEGTPVNDTVDAEFTFYNAASGGSIQGAPITQTVEVANGYFGTRFSQSDISGVDFTQALWVEVKINGNTLSPRSAINSVPVANNALGVLSYASAPTVGIAGSLYYDNGDEQLYISNGTSWVPVSIGSGWETSGDDVSFMGGNVGIGTTTPSEKLSVDGNVLSTEGVYSQSISTYSYATFMAASDYNVQINDDWSPGDYLGTILANGNIGIGYGAIQLLNNGNASFSGNVGIGTTTPASALVVSDDASTIVSFRNSANADAGFDFIVTDEDLGNGNYVAPIGSFGANANGLYTKYGPDSIDWGKVVYTNLLGNLSLPDGQIRGGTILVANEALDVTSILLAGIVNEDEAGLYNGGDELVAGFNYADSLFKFGNNALNINSSGNVGIGTSNPNHALSFSNAGATIGIADQLAYDTPGGALTITGGVGTAGGNAGGDLILKGGNSFTGENHAAGDVKIYGGVNNFDSPLYGGAIRMYTSGAERFTVLNDGNVGIGTSNPTSILSINDNGTGGDLLTVGTNAEVRYLNVSAGGLVTIGDIDNVADGAIFTTTGSNFAFENGNVGIGTTDPQYKLDVQGGNLYVINGFNGIFLGENLANEGEAGLYESGSYGQIATYGVFDSSDEPLYVYANGVLNVNSSGNVGIGTTDPIAKLHVVSEPGEVEIALFKNEESGSIAAIASNNLLGGNSIEFIDSLNDGLIAGRNTDTGTYFYGGGILVADTEGHVGIGTTTPTRALTVVGTVFSSNLLGGATTLSTDANGNIIRSPSDQSLKENINTIENALDKISQLRGVSYEWLDKARFGTSTEIGVIAQEVERVVPEVVSSGGEYKSVKIANLVGLLIEAVKELKTKVDTLASWFSGNSLKVKGDICVDDVCVTKDQFKQMLQREGGYTVPSVTTPTPAPTVPVVDPAPEQTEPESVEPEPVSEPVIAPEPTPEPVSVSEPEAAI
jgi:hypothetical protein